MDTNENTRLLLKDEVYQIVGSAIEVLNELGHGLSEKPYENALVVEFGLRNISFKQQTNYVVLDKGRPVGLLVPDLTAFDSVIVDAKVIDRITDIERGKMVNYVKITTDRVCVILNFKNPKLESERIAL